MARYRKETRKERAWARVVAHRYEAPGGSGLLVRFGAVIVGRGVSYLKALMHAVQRARAKQAKPKLSLCNSLSLGEKRFVAVIEFERDRFLIGGASNAVCLLANLGERPEPVSPFADTLHAATAREYRVQ